MSYKVKVKISHRLQFFVRALDFHYHGYLVIYLLRHFVCLLSLFNDLNGGILWSVGFGFDSSLALYVKIKLIFQCFFVSDRNIFTALLLL